MSPRRVVAVVITSLAAAIDRTTMLLSLLRRARAEGDRRHDTGRSRSRRGPSSRRDALDNVTADTEAE